MPKNKFVDAMRPFAWLRVLPSKRLLPPLFSALLILMVPRLAHSQEEVLPVPDGEVILTIAGKIMQTNMDGKAVLDEATLSALPPSSLETTTVVTDGVKQFDGFLMRDLLDFVGAEGKSVTATALNEYAIDIPVEDFKRFDVLVATHMDGQRLLPSDKGPLWIVYPRDAHAELQDIRYDYRWVWQLVRLDIE